MVHQPAGGLSLRRGQCLWYRSDLSEDSSDQRWLQGHDVQLSTSLHEGSKSCHPIDEEAIAKEVAEEEIDRRSAETELSGLVPSARGRVHLLQVHQGI